ncbi:hypothetical protein CWM47_19830 [Spirosoma pollinicola]|uniref:Uncharacterized protein n=1 Tax=Spirosoma pollinicola TaxID=2057025 RepID=A0A2K8Z219_9BACT|nr:hypothetical protein CWM47_19830 [Spirosoma pollinicola]
MSVGVGAKIGLGVSPFGPDKAVVVKARESIHNLLNIRLVSAFSRTKDMKQTEILIKITLLANALLQRNYRLTSTSPV